LVVEWELQCAFKSQKFKMQFKNVETLKQKNLGICEIKNKKKNSLDFETINDIVNSLIFLESDSEVNLLAIIGNEKFFSPGADINQLKDLNNKKAQEKKLFSSFDQLENIKIPICAIVEGYALGGGMELALMCDFIIASPSAKFSQPEINLGLIPGIGGTQRLKKYVGKYNANFLCMSGEMISAQEGKDFGFVSKIIEKNNFKSSAIKLATEIASKPKESLIEIKRLIKLDNNLKDDLLDERSSFYNLLDKENKNIGIDAFLNKKEPKWKN
jgi:enoyl-CoA hydratase/carnithine racemase